MSNKGTIAETYSNLNKVLELLKKQHTETNLIESVKVAQQYLISLELMAIAANKG
jgi:hypothetical protein